MAMPFAYRQQAPSRTTSQRCWRSRTKISSRALHSFNLHFNHLFYPHRFKPLNRLGHYFLKLNLWQVPVPQVRLQRRWFKLRQSKAQRAERGRRRRMRAKEERPERRRHQRRIPLGAALALPRQRRRQQRRREQRHRYQTPCLNPPSKSSPKLLKMDFL